MENSIAPEKMLDRKIKVSFDRALCACQGEIPRIKKIISTSIGGTYFYNFAAMDEIVDIAKPILSKHGFTFTTDAFHHKDKNNTTVIIGHLRHIGGHEMTSEFEASSNSFSNHNNALALACLETFARLHILCRFMNIALPEDYDANGDSAN